VRERDFHADYRFDPRLDVLRLTLSAFADRNHSARDSELAAIAA
jgi:hypothetical protein